LTFRELGIDLPIAFEGDQYTQCPKCSSTRKKKKVKCLSANSDKGVFNCHHCGWSGNTKSGTLSKGDPSSWKRKPYRRPTFKRNKLPIDILFWFKNRGISKETLTRNDISYGQAYMPQQEDFVPAIQFPYKKDGKVVNIKYRDLKKNFRQESGAESIVYKFDDINKISDLIICEGEIDALSLVYGLSVGR